jgi:hypothetical protein
MEWLIAVIHTFPVLLIMIPFVRQKCDLVALTMIRLQYGVLKFRGDNTSHGGKFTKR